MRSPPNCRPRLFLAFAAPLLAGCNCNSQATCLATVCTTLLMYPAFAAHQAAVQASPGLQSKLVALVPDMIRGARECLDAALQRAHGPEDQGSSAGSTRGPGAQHPSAGADSLAVVMSHLQLVAASCLTDAVHRLVGAAAAAQPHSQQRQQQRQPVFSWVADLAALLDELVATWPSPLPAAEFTRLLLYAVFVAVHPFSFVWSAAAASTAGASQDTIANF